MSERQRGRPPRRWVIRRLRLINFHNFVDETIEVRDGGHLFLLGDNGSGKTTVLDALHYVLGGGQDSELNAAARIGGRREEGRTIQGVVLRYDAERGVVNEGGAIAYAVVELGADDGEVLCLGVGVEATTLEARPVRWGLVTRATLEALPVVVAEGDARRPATREELRAQLPRSDSFGQLAEYRKVVAERLFGGEGLYQEVCRFWSMAKAYREIVTGARDFGTLFQRLLPAPDSEVFADILRSLRAIDALEVTLREIDAQREYVAGLVALSSEIDAHRDAASRYRWLLAFRALGDARRRRQRSVDAARAIALELQRLEAEVQIARARCDEAEQALRACATADGEALIQAIATTEAKVRERAGLAEQARIAAEEGQRAEIRARQRAAELRADEAAALADVTRALADLGLPGASARVARGRGA